MPAAGGKVGIIEPKSPVKSRSCQDASKFNQGKGSTKVRLLDLREGYRAVRVVGVATQISARAIGLKCVHKSKL